MGGSCAKNTNTEKSVYKTPKEAQSDSEGYINKKLQQIYAELLLEKQEGGNLVMSPASILVAFATLAEGLSGTRKQECIDVFGFDCVDILPGNLLAYIQKLMKSGSGGGGGYLTMANSLWVPSGYPLTSSYQGISTSKYCSEIRSVNFSDQAKTVSEINQWVSMKTGNLIQNLLSSCNPNTALLIINTILFKGVWKKKFDKNLTKVRDFYLEKGLGSVKANFMHQEASFGYRATEDHTYVSIPYANSSIYFVACLPTEERKNDPGVHSRVSDKQLKTACILGKDIEAGFGPKVRLFLPKFSIDIEVDFVSILKTLGMTELFKPDDHDEDFSKISAVRGLFVSSVKHRARIEVDEEGTVATAATAVAVVFRSLPPPPKTVVFDRPFSFYLYDLENEFILFSGVVKNPASSS